MQVNKIVIYTLRKIRSRIFYELFLVIVISSIFLYPIYQAEYSQNRLFLVAYRHTPIQFSSIKSLEEINGIRYLLAMNFKLIRVNKQAALLIETSYIFGSFVERYLIQGSLPTSDSELLTVALYDNNLTVGNFIVINGSKYEIIGVLSPKAFDIAETTLPQISLILIKIYRAHPPLVRNLIIGFSVFADVGRSFSKVSTFLKEYNFTISEVSFEPTYVLNTMRFTFAMLFFVEIFVLYIIIYKLRKECGVLFALGWPYKVIFFRIIFELLLIISLGYVLNYLIIYFLVNTLSRLYFFLEIPIYFYFTSFVVFIISVIAISRLVTLKGIHEALNL